VDHLLRGAATRAGLAQRFGERVHPLGAVDAALVAQIVTQMMTCCRPDLGTASRHGHHDTELDTDRATAAEDDDRAHSWPLARRVGVG